MEADASPFPSDETTPPVTKINLFMVPLSPGRQVDRSPLGTSSLKKHPAALQLTFDRQILLQSFRNIRHVFRTIHPQ